MAQVEGQLPRAERRRRERLEAKSKDATPPPMEYVATPPPPTEEQMPQGVQIKVMPAPVPQRIDVDWVHNMDGEVWCLLTVHDQTGIKWTLMPPNIAAALGAKLRNEEVPSNVAPAQKLLVASAMPRPGEIVPGLG